MTHIALAYRVRMRAIDTRWEISRDTTGELNWRDRVEMRSRGACPLHERRRGEPRRASADRGPARTRAKVPAALESSRCAIGTHRDDMATALGMPEPPGRRAHAPVPRMRVVIAVVARRRHYWGRVRRLHPVPERMRDVPLRPRAADVRAAGLTVRCACRRHDL